MSFPAMVHFLSNDLLCRCLLLLLLLERDVDLVEWRPLERRLERDVPYEE